MDIATAIVEQRHTLEAEAERLARSEALGENVDVLRGAEVLQRLGIEPAAWAARVERFRQRAADAAVLAERPALQRRQAELSAEHQRLDAEWRATLARIDAERRPIAQELSSLESKLHATWRAEEKLRSRPNPDADRLQAENEQRRKALVLERAIVSEKRTYLSNMMTFPLMKATLTWQQQQAFPVRLDELADELERIDGELQACNGRDAEIDASRLLP